MRQILLALFLVFLVGCAPKTYSIGVGTSGEPYELQIFKDSKRVATLTPGNPEVTLPEGTYDFKGFEKVNGIWQRAVAPGETDLREASRVYLHSGNQLIFKSLR